MAIEWACTALPTASPTNAADVHSSIIQVPASDAAASTSRGKQAAASPRSVHVPLGITAVQQATSIDPYDELGLYAAAAVLVGMVLGMAIMWDLLPLTPSFASSSSSSRRHTRRTHQSPPPR